MSEVLLRYGMIPPAALRGNTRLHAKAKAWSVKQWRESGYAHALEFMQRHPETTYPLQGRLVLYVYVASQWRIDGDNLWAGCKPIIDGLQDAGLIENDRQIGHWGLDVRKVERRDDWYDTNDGDMWIHLRVDEDQEAVGPNVWVRGPVLQE